MKTMWILALALAVASCSKKGGDACTDAVNKAVDQMMSRMSGANVPDEMKAAMKERGDALKKVIITRCTEDKWPAEVTDCYAKAASREDIKACRAKLPADQSSKLQAEEMQVMMSGGGMGMAPHGGGGAPPAEQAPPAPTPAPTPPAPTNP
jgi:hypothetical protein